MQTSEFKTLWEFAKFKECKWRIRSKLRQPNFYHDGMTDHPDRNGRPDVQPHMQIKGFNGEWMEFDQNEVRAGRMLATPVTQNESSAALDSLSLTGS